MQGFIWGRYIWNHVMEILLELPKTSCYGKSCYGSIMLGEVLLYFKDEKKTLVENLTYICIIWHEN